MPHFRVDFPGDFANMFARVGLVAGSTETRDLATCFYFSAVTFTTLGYGDVHPSASARPLAIFEVMFGYLFLGAVVSVVGTLLNVRDSDKA